MRRALLPLCGAAILLAGMMPARAALDFKFVPAGSFSGTPATGLLDALFTDGVGGVVTLTISSALGGGELVLPQDGFYFNYDPSKDPTKLLFSLQTNTGFATAATAHTGVDAFKPDGDGLMDIKLTWPGGTQAFTAGESQTYFITAAGGVSASDFNFLSNCGQGCGNGAHYAAVHIGNTPGQSSDWDGATVTNTNQVPEPMTLALLGTAVAGLVVVRRRRKA